MRLHRLGLATWVLTSLSVVAAAACSDTEETKQPLASGGAGGTAGSGGTGGTTNCPTSFEVGDATGHADVYGAKAASQARAGRITDAAQIVQPAHGRQRINVGDYVLANDKIAVTIEDKGLSDGYARFGGEILAVDQVGDDGRPLGRSNYVETLMALSIQMINPTSVSVINDGSDGNAAVVRVTGPLEAIPFLNGSLAALFPRRYDVDAAYDYVLEPGAEKLDIRLGIANPTSDPIEFAIGSVTDEMHGFFQQNHNQFATEGSGFSSANGEIPWAGFVSGAFNFAWRLPHGKKLNTNLEISGFQYFTGPGFAADACGITWNDHVEVIGGGPDYDGLREAIRRVDGDTAWQAVSGQVLDSSGGPVADAWVHATAADGSYLSRTKSASDGSYTIHVPPDTGATLTPQKLGYALPGGTNVGAGVSSQDLSFAATGAIHVVATDAAQNAPMPVRIQVIPTSAPPSWPESFGVADEANGRLHQHFAMNGDATLLVPPGEHRVIVSHGGEWEISDTTISVNAGETAQVAASLEHSVDSTGIMCADFHIHSAQSADSHDPIVEKVKSAIADGLEIPVSSEHEWVVDFGPVVESLGMTDWAFGMPSQELTTFSWGHFGVVPLLPKPDQVNNGAVEWVGLEPPQMFDNVQNLPEDPVFIINHPSGGGFGAYFSSARFDRTTGAGKTANLWSTNFDAIEVFNDSSFDDNRDKSVGDWFALLNHGYTFWAVGSSDSHKLRTSPVGYPRTCIDFGFDDPKQLTINSVRDAVASGNTTISGGLLMTVVGPGGAKPGETITETSADFTVTVQSPSWYDATTLEVIVNGVTVDEQALLPMGSGTGHRYVNVVHVDFDANAGRSWVVFHAKGTDDLSPLHPGRDAFAVSNPIFSGAEPLGG
ncbi:MAG: CehA/McbA family metallohydrolase [Polyangiaceae bacterium]|nr:CehA/McbA family metallohydrolase [Polyangiaceae bacterium]MCB9604948.1 CehA/McbA family metallohydrolase [Polyangiaceae bacterium]